MSTQELPQTARFDAQESVQTPAAQTEALCVTVVQTPQEPQTSVSTGQVLLQPPQCSGLDDRSTHSPPHNVNEPGQGSGQSHSVQRTFQSPSTQWALAVSSQQDLTTVT